MNNDVSEAIDTLDHLGPVSFIAVEFPDGQVSGDGFTRLVDLVAEGLVVVIDLEFVRRTDDGSLSTVPAASLDLGADLSVLEGADSGLLDRDDLELVAGDLVKGSVLAVLVYEDLALEPVLRAWVSGGATLVAEGHVAPDDLENALGAQDEYLGG